MMSSREYELLLLQQQQQQFVGSGGVPFLQTRISKSAPCSPVKPVLRRHASATFSCAATAAAATAAAAECFHVIHKVPVGDTPYVKAKYVQLVDKDPDRAIALFWAAINAGDRVDSALKDMAIVMKQQNRAEEAIEAIKSLRNRCSDQAQESLDNVLLDLYKRCGRLDDQIALLKHKLHLINEGMAFNGKRTKTARSQGRKFQVSIEQEATRLLGNLGWAYMQQSSYVAAEVVYRKALSIEPDNNKVCNLGICLMKQGRLEEARQMLRSVTPASANGRCGSDSHFKSYERAQDMLRELDAYMHQPNMDPAAALPASIWDSLAAQATVCQVPETSWDFFSNNQVPAVSGVEGEPEQEQVLSDENVGNSRFTSFSHFDFHFPLQRAQQQARGSSGVEERLRFPHAAHTTLLPQRGLCADNAAVPSAALVPLTFDRTNDGRLRGHCSNNSSPLGYKGREKAVHIPRSAPPSENKRHSSSSSQLSENRQVSAARRSLSRDLCNAIGYASPPPTAAANDSTCTATDDVLLLQRKHISLTSANLGEAALEPKQQQQQQQRGEVEVEVRCTGMDAPPIDPTAYQQQQRRLRVFLDMTLGQLYPGPFDDAAIRIP